MPWAARKVGTLALHLMWHCIALAGCLFTPWCLWLLQYNTTQNKLNFCYVYVLVHVSLSLSLSLSLCPLVVIPPSSFLLPPSSSSLLADAFYYQQFQKTLSSAFLVARRQAVPLLCFLRTLLLAGVADFSDTQAVEAAIRGEWSIVEWSIVEYSGVEYSGVEWSGV